MKKPLCPDTGAFLTLSGGQRLGQRKNRRMNCAGGAEYGKLYRSAENRDERKVS